MGGMEKPPIFAEYYPKKAGKNTRLIGSFI
jgi:hypothetical protein